MAFIHLEIKGEQFTLSSNISSVDSKPHLIQLIRAMKVALHQVSDESLHSELDEMWASAKISGISLVSRTEIDDSNDNDLRNLNL